MSHLRTIVNFPKFFLTHLLALADAVLGEFEVFLVAVIGVLLAFVLSPFLAAAIALSVYLVLRQFSAVFGNHARVIGEQINFAARCIRDRPTP